MRVSSTTCPSTCVEWLRWPTYGGGTDDGDVHVGGNPTSDWDPFWIEVSGPGQTYWLNPDGAGDLYCHELDFTYTLPGGRRRHGRAVGRVGRGPVRDLQPG